MTQGCYETHMVVTPDLCDAAARLSPLAAFTVFQGLAACHAEQIGVGGAAMAQRGEFWLTVHCRVDFARPARLMDTLTAVTWPEPCDPKSARCFRSYELLRGGERVAVGRTQWAILGPAHKLLRFGESGFPADFPFPARAGIAEAPTRFDDDFADEHWVRSCAVRATDIDFGQHMNNVAYVRTLLDCFSAAELASGAIASVEVHYCAPCLEGEMLTVYKKPTEAGECRLAIKKADGKAAVLAAVRFRG